MQTNRGLITKGAIGPQKDVMYKTNGGCSKHNESNTRSQWKGEGWSLFCIAVHVNSLSFYLCPLFCSPLFEPLDPPLVNPIIFCILGITMVRLQDVSPDVPNAGRVQVKEGGRWKDICSAGWDVKDVAVACRQLGFPGGAFARTTSQSNLTNESVTRFGCEGRMYRSTHGVYFRLYPVESSFQEGFGGTHIF